jgi:type IX secretion system PorP/SprF family membrane protein
MSGPLKRLGYIMALLLSGGLLYGQQFPPTSHYIFNPYSINPAFAGAFNRSEFNLNYRRDWVSIPGSPQTYRMNGNRHVFRNMYLGGEVMADFADIFYRVRLGLSYSYRLQVGYEQYLSFGLSGHLYQSLIRLDQANVDLNDPVLRDLDRLINTSYNAAFGLVYQKNDLIAGFGMPLMFRTKDAYTTGTFGVFAFEQAYNFYLSNTYEIDDMWQVRPGFMLSKTINNPAVVDVSGLFIYDRQVWLGALFRSTALLGFTVGARVYDRMTLNYTYELGVGGIGLNSGGGHEITIGLSRKNDEVRYHRGRTATAAKSAYAPKSSSIRNEQSKDKKSAVSRQKPDKRQSIKKEKPARTRRLPARQPQYAPYEKF